MESTFCHLQAQQLFESQAKWEAQSALKAQGMVQRKQQQEAAAQADAELLRCRREIAQKLAADQAKDMEDLIKQQVHSTTLHKLTRTTESPSHVLLPVFVT